MPKRLNSPNSQMSGLFVHVVDQMSWPENPVSIFICISEWTVFGFYISAPDCTFACFVPGFCSTPFIEHSLSKFFAVSCEIMIWPRWAKSNQWPNSLRSNQNQIKAKKIVSKSNQIKLENFGPKSNQIKAQMFGPKSSQIKSSSNILELNQIKLEKFGAKSNQIKIWFC